jgi:hypothetical protein
MIYKIKGTTAQRLNGVMILKLDLKLDLLLRPCAFAPLRLLKR